ncbi:4Fe-4S dicluster domain-containing protein [Skermania sp. ID1734]|uniref:(Fe-S)-binding protein n=1 Tax=Skermania sp. ID1734 TaxID=2597516 RepID=UPI00117E4BCF|nr:(Fe-S)-binding protein [Skermania sp. ID1734]TSE00457.1 4Fe-4S dicluster domain-containing protein [Skermania sp. ID1734]
MNALTITLGTIGALLSVLCWASFVSGAWGIFRSVMLGQPAPDRWHPFWPRFKHMFVEFLAHTRMVKFRTVGWAHWLVMIGFLAGMSFWFEAYGQTFDPTWGWPLIGGTWWFHLGDELLGVGTVIGIVTLMIIRQLNHPRIPDRLSRFSGSVFSAGYFVEWVVLLEGLGMVLVKAGALRLHGEFTPWTDFVTGPISKVLPDSVALISIFAFVKLMSGMVWLFVVGRNMTWGVAWHRFSAFPNIYFKREADGGVALGAAKPMMSGGKVLNMEDADPDVDAFGAGKIEDFSWKGWLDFTTCTECGRCQSQCPAWNTGKPLSPKLLIMSLRDHGYAKAPYLLAGGKKDMGGDEIGLSEADLAKLSDAARAEAERPLVGPEDAHGIIDPEVLWSCTTCGACVEQCPVDIEHVDHIIDMRRYQVLIESEFPSELAGLFKNLENKGNPWGQNAKDRLNWISEMDFHIPVYGQDADTFEDYEYLFWVGCAGAYEDRAKKTTKAVAELLATAGVKFMVLGAEETCTGDSARRAGNEFLFQQLAMQNIETFNAVFDGVPEEKRKIVVTCAHCFNALGNEYPQVGGKYEVIHHTQLLNRLVRAKKLVPVAPVSDEVTYHDPCYLGRHNKVYDAPRELMAASGSTLREMPRHGERSMCCGAGGARMWMEEQLGKRINIDRVDEALSTLGSNGSGPQKIATGCPFCRVMLTDGVTARQESGEGEGVEVIDVAQLMLGSIRRLEPDELTENIKVIQKPKTTKQAEVATEVTAEQEEAGRVETIEEPAESPAETAPAAKAAPAKGLAMKGLAKAPGAKAPGAKAPGAKAPGAKAPGKPAEAAAPAEDAAPKAPVKGLAMKGMAKAPGAKAPGAKAPGKAADAKPEAAEAAKPAETAEASTPKPPVKGLAMKGMAKAPGAKAPGAKAPGAKAPGKAAAPAQSADSAAPKGVDAPEAEAPTEPKAGAEASMPSVAPKGLAVKSGFKKPGARPSAAPKPAEQSNGSSETAAEKAPEPSEPSKEPAASGNGEAAAPPAAKPGGLGFKAGAKAPGRRS